MIEYLERNKFWRGFFLHTVVVAAPKGGVLILGHSGAGKTTLSKLLQEKFTPFLDDIAYIAQHKATRQWFVTDGKKMETSFNGWIPLFATIRTIQADEPSMTQIPPREVCKYLADAIFENYLMCKVDPKLQKMAFASVAEIARQYPGWRLLATLCPQTPDLVWKNLQ